MKYGPETPTVEAFIRHLKGMTKKQWAAVDAAADVARYATACQRASTEARDAAWNAALKAVGHAAREAARDVAALDAAWYAARGATGTAARYAADYATYEILGAPIMRERGQSFYFLPMFGFKNPEAVLAEAKLKEPDQ